ncbi:hypothetical protein HDK90DRAFT_236789 [Phyllosticta capitalensis]|uniref:Nephrocystin 3-like N-terminal domain-containing protein n=1 Tax=Phyllosticta capitalensis TaxID=121624 RepID=A0ABR1YP30_9PEZI
MESTFLPNFWSTTALAAVASLLLIDICLRIFEYTRQLPRRSPNGNATAAEVLENASDEATASQNPPDQDGSIRSRHSTLETDEETKSSPFSDNDTLNQLQAFKEPEKLISLVPPSIEPLESPKTSNNRLAKPQLKPETVFRLQGLPIDYKGRQVGISEAEQIIRKALSVEEDIGVSFTQIPSEVERRMNSDSNPNFLFNDTTRVVKLSLDKDFIHFTPLHSPPDKDHHLDVIALPGLGGHAFGSFKARKDDYMWLRDGLCESFPSARVLIYGYDTRLQNSSAFQSLQDLGLDFSHKLVAQIKSSIRTSRGMRPIVLVGQSLGGLVIKEALCQLAYSRQEEANILKSVEAVFFFGTPNSESADLRRLGEKWSRITDVRMGEHTSPTLRIYSFYETLESPTAIKTSDGGYEMTGPAVVLVDRTSATHGRPWGNDNSIVIPIHATHSGMAKFKSINDGTYRDNIVLGLNDVLENNQSIHPEGMLSWKDQELLDRCLNRLSFPEQQYHKHHIIVAQNNTCEWILEHEAYRKWLSTLEPLLWIEGHAGAGKSTVLKHALQRYEDEISRRVIVASYFFSGRGTDLQKTPIGLYRWLLRQLVPHFPRTFWRLVQEYEEKSRSSQDWDWQPEELRRVLEDHLAKAGSRRPIIVFIDALDECPEIHRKELIGFIETVLGSSQRGQIKMCVSCRHFPNLFTDGLKISVENHNGRDIETFVRSQLSAMKHREREEFEQQIISKANGIFQWAVLVCSRILEMNQEGRTAKMIQLEIDKSPKGLDDLYESLLRQSPEDHEQAIKLFQWVCFVKQPPTLLELQWILVLSLDLGQKSLEDFRKDGYRTKARYLEDCEDSVHFRETPEELFNAIRHLSKGLIGFTAYEPETPFDNEHSGLRKLPSVADDTDDKVEPVWLQKAFLVHQSVKEYLCRRGLAILGGLKLDADPYGHAHDSISRLCLDFILRENKKVIDGDELARLSRSYLHRCFWSRFKHHIINSGFHDMDQTYILDVFCTLHRESSLDRLLYSMAIHDSDFHELCHDFDITVFRLCKAATLPFVLAYCGISSALKALVIYNNEWVAGNLGEKSEALGTRVSICIPQERSPFEFLPSGLLNLDQESVEQGITPLRVATFCGHITAVKCLLECSTVDPNRPCRLGKTAFHCAADKGNSQVLRALLDSNTVNSNFQDCWGRTALHWSLEFNCLPDDTIQYWLASPQVDLNVQDQEGTTAIQKMIQNFTYRQKLLEFDWIHRIDPNIRDRYGKTLLHSAVFYCLIPLVKALLDAKDIDPHIRDSFGDPPIFELCRTQDLGKGDIRRMLEVMDPRVKNERGQTLLHRAVHEEEMTLIRALIEDNRVNVDETDDADMTALSVAEKLVGRTDSSPNRWTAHDRRSILKMLQEASTLSKLRLPLHGGQLPPRPLVPTVRFSSTITSAPYPEW